MMLSPMEARVVGSLIEKSTTTPDGYPLSTNALRLACNQKSSRHPVVDYSAREIDATMMELRQGGWARTVHGSGRTDKHKHVVDEALGVNPAEVAILGVLLLRGPQTVPELRSRAERMHPFTDLDEVDATLQRLADRDDPLVVLLHREARQREDRWVQLLTGEPDLAALAADANALSGSPRSATGSGGSSRADVASLETRLATVEARLGQLCEMLGVELDDLPGAAGD